MLVASILMCGIVLIQNSKGGGLASGFSSSNAIMGVRKTTDFLEKATWTLAGAMVVCSILSAYALSYSTGASQDILLQQALEQQSTNPYNWPVGTEAPADETPAPAPAEDGAAAPDGGK